MVEATGGLAAVRIIRAGMGDEIAVPAHDGELVFGFILDGAAVLQCDSRTGLGAGDAFVIPPARLWQLSKMSPDCRVLHVTTARFDDDRTEPKISA